MPKAGLWMSYDLGVSGDYEGMYLFLDTFNARDCGANSAYFFFPIAKASVASSVRRELKKLVAFRARDRVYLIFPTADGKYKGAFIVGKRRRAPWQGYATQFDGDVDDPE